MISKFNNYIDTDQKKDVYEELVKKLEEDFKDRKNKYVLKLKYFEEFMYGDYPICTYEPLRILVREYETVNLILMKFPVNEVVVQPDTTHFPPIVYVSPDKEYNYPMLLQLYIDLFVSDRHSDKVGTKNPVIFRFKPDESQHDLYFKKPMERKEKLLKFVESGECDYPLYINIKGIKNLFALKKHMDSKNYNEMEMDLPYFNAIPSMDSIRNKKNLLQKMMEKFCSACKAKNKNKKDKEKEKNHEEEEHKKQLKTMIEKYKKSLKVQNELNYLRVPHKFDPYEKKMNIFSNRLMYSTALLDRLKDLSTEKKNHKDLKKKENLNNVENFALSNYKIQFLPCFIKIEIILMYGSFEIQKLSTRFLILNNNINIDEKISFQHLLISHLPRETRIAINLLAYDKYQQNFFELGSCSTPLYDDNGIMEQGVIPLYIWPLFKTDPRIVCCFPYKGKYQMEGNKGPFNEDDYCVLYIEFPKFVRPVAYVLKSPQSYREYLKLKYPNEDKINNTYEMKILYSNSMDQLEEILDNLKNRDQYFLKLDKKKKEMKEKRENYSHYSRSKKNSDHKEEESYLIENKKK